MRRVALLLALPLLGCGPSGGAALSAEALSEGCVATALGLLQEAADRLAPLSEAGSVEDIERLAAELGIGCAREAGGAVVLRCEGVELRGGVVTLIARVEVGARLLAEIAVEGTALAAHGSVAFAPGPDGVGASGALSVLVGECAVDIAFDPLTFRMVADLEEKPVGAVCVAGTVEVEVSGGGGGAYGVAAFTGRDAFVMLSAGGALFQGSVALR
jgi:hypothetical protein